MQQKRLSKCLESLARRERRRALPHKILVASPMNPYDAGTQANKKRLRMGVINLRRKCLPHICLLGLYCIASAIYAV